MPELYYSINALSAYSGLFNQRQTGRRHIYALLINYGKYRKKRMFINQKPPVLRLESVTKQRAKIPGGRKPQSRFDRIIKSFHIEIFLQKYLFRQNRRKNSAPVNLFEDKAADDNTDGPAVLKFNISAEDDNVPTKEDDANKTGVDVRLPHKEKEKEEREPEKPNVCPLSSPLNVGGSDSEDDIMLGSDLFSTKPPPISNFTSDKKTKFESLFGDDSSDDSDDIFADIKKK